LPPKVFITGSNAKCVPEISDSFTTPKFNGFSSKKSDKNEKNKITKMFFIKRLFCNFICDKYVTCKN